MSIVAKEVGYRKKRRKGKADAGAFGQHSSKSLKHMLKFC